MHTPKVYRLYWLALLLAALAPVQAWCQSSNGSVRGIVQDATQAIIMQVDVKLTNSATGVALESKSNDAGIFVFPAVQPGAYKLTATFSGMANYEAALTVRVGESSNLTIVMKPASTQTEVTVSDATPLVVTDNPVIGHTLERMRIEQLPINGRQVTNLLATVASVQFDANGDIRTNAMVKGGHDFTLDGAALTDALDGGGTFKRQPGLDTIQEFRVETNSVSAREPRTTNVILRTKSGTNQIHGSLFETNRDNSYGKARAREDSNTASHLVRNEYGGTIGGPVFIPKVYNGKNKTFWFFSYEGLKLRQGVTANVAVPTEAMRGGDFSGLKDAAGTQQRIYDWRTTDPATFARQQFSYGGKLNAIDPALESNLAKYFAEQLPMPTKPDVNPLVASNWFGPRPDSTNERTISARFDHQFNDKNQVYVRLTEGFSDRLRATKAPITADGGGNWRRDYFPSKSGAANWTHTFSPTFFSETTFSASREYGSIYTGEPGQIWAGGVIPGLANPLGQDGYPIIGTVGVKSSGNYLQPQNNRVRAYTFYILDENLTKIHGRHELQFGAHFRKDFLNYLPQQQRTGGSYSAAAVTTALYDPNQASRNKGVPNTGSAAAAWFLGFDDIQYRQAKGMYYMRQNEDALYFQDNFRATTRLTLNLGVRWQMSPAPYDKYNVLSSWDPNNQAIVLGQPLEDLYKMNATNSGLVGNLQAAGVQFETYDQAGLSKRMVDSNWHDIGPHLGFAYRALEGRKEFILRGGYSVNYHPVFMAGWNDRMRLNSPFTGFFDNRPYTAAQFSPDKKRNYGLVMTSPVLVAGNNTTNAISTSDARALEVGADAFQAAYWGRNQASPRIDDWNLTLEKQLIEDTVLRVSYQGAHGSNQDTLNDMNPAYGDYGSYAWLVKTGTPIPDDYVQQRLLYKSTGPMSAMGDIQRFQRDGISNSTMISVELERRYNKGFGYQFIYVMNNNAGYGGLGWQSQIEPAEMYLPGEVPTDYNARAKFLNYARDFTLPKHDFRWNWVVDLPIGKGKPLLRNSGKLLDAIAGGWQVTGMGRARSNYTTLNNFDPSSDIWANGNNLEYYGHKYPIKDCRSGECQDGWLLYNGYIPAFQINQPGGIMGVPSDYKPAGTPVWAYPANYNSLQSDDPNAPGYDPNYGYYGTNTVKVPMKDGSYYEVDKGSLNPWRNQALLSTYLWTVDASLGKTFKFTESLNLRLQVDAFNVFNVAGNSFTPGDTTGVVTSQYSQNAPRTLQLSGRLTW